MDFLACAKANNEIIAGSAFSAFFCPFITYFVGSPSGLPSSGT